MDERLVVFRVLLPRMEPSHFETLRLVCGLLFEYYFPLASRVLLTLLIRIQKLSAFNRMDAKNLSAIFAPTMMRSPEGKDLAELPAQARTTCFLITNYETVFKSL